MKYCQTKVTAAEHGSSVSQLLGGAQIRPSFVHAAIAACSAEKGNHLSA
jgi:hypothetical protein